MPQLVAAGHKTHPVADQSFKQLAVVKDNVSPEKADNFPKPESHSGTRLVAGSPPSHLLP